MWGRWLKKVLLVRRTLWCLRVPSRRQDAASVIIESGGAAPLASGSCIATQGSTVVYASAVWRSASVNKDDIPLNVEYRHKGAASGMIPAANSRRRESQRLTEAEILASRAIDRALRPRFINSSLEQAHVILTVHASDGVHDPICLATNAASAALALSGVSWMGPIGCARVAGQEPTADASVDVARESGLDILYATGCEGAGALALEIGCMPQQTDAAIHAALRLAHDAAFDMAQAIAQLAEGAEADVAECCVDDHVVRWLDDEIDNAHGHSFVQLFSGQHQENNNKAGRGRAQHALNNQAMETALTAIKAMALDEQAATAFCERAVERCAKRSFEKAVATNGARADQRRLDEVRRIKARVAALPAPPVHGSALFSRGESCVLASATVDAPPRFRRRSADHSPSASWTEHQTWRTTTIKARPRRAAVASLAEPEEPRTPMSYAFAPRLARHVSLDEEHDPADDFDEAYDRRLLVHYDFPAAATGSVAIASERRAVGHGALAERALAGVFPPAAIFPYAARVAVDVLASNGSTSMAAVCAASMALADAGVPHEPVAGVSIGACGPHILVDLTGTEDHYGDMDFKIAGTKKFITAAQLDVKQPTGVPLSTICRALSAAKLARRYIISAMQKKAVVSEPRPPPLGKSVLAPYSTIQREPLPWPSSLSLKPHAPRVERVEFARDRLVDLLGPRGQTLRDIQAAYRCEVDTSYDGEVTIFARDAVDAANAKKHVEDLVRQVKVGDRLDGVILDKREYGALVQILRNREGLLHISEYKGAPDYPENLDVGDHISVVVLGLDPILGNIKLSRRALGSSI